MGKKKSGAITTILGPETKVEGTIDFKGNIRIDGRINGRIISEEGAVVIGEKAVVNADIYVDEAFIMGEVMGTIDARDKIVVYPQGRVSGDIQAPVVTIDPGASFNGNCEMKARESTPEKIGGTSEAK